MPRIPSYQQQVAPQGLPDARLSEVRAPLTTAVPVIQQAIGVAGSQWDQAQHKDDIARVQDAENQAQQAKLDVGQWASNFKGKQALDPSSYGGEEEKGRGARSLEEVTLRKYDQATQQIQDGLATDTQKRMFQQSSTRFRLDLQGLVGRHVDQQDRAYKVDTFQGVQAMEDANVAQNAVGTDGRLDADTVAQSLARKVYAAKQLSEYLGEAPALAAARVLEAQSGSHGLVLDGLLKANNPQGAQTYFDLNKAQMDPKVIGSFETRIKDNALANTVQAQADRIAGLGLTLEKQDAAAQEAMKGNPEGLRLLRSEIEHRFQVHHTSQVAAIQDAEGQIWGSVYPVDGKGGVSIAASIKAQPDAWRALGGDGAAALKAKLEAYGRRNENDPALQVAKYAAFLRILDDPKRLAALTDDQLVAQMPVLGADLTTKLLDAKRKAAGNLDQLNRATLNDLPTKIHDIGVEYGLKVSGNSAKPEDLALLGQLKDKAIDAVRAEQQASGKEVLPDRKEEIVRNLIRGVKVKPAGAWWGTTKPLFTVGSFMDLQATNEEKTQALDYLTRAGAPTDAVSVQTMIDAIRARKGK